MQFTFSQLKAEFQKKILNPLPGVNAQMIMAPLGRENQNIEALNKAKVKHAAVLILFTEVNEKPCFILTKRVKYPGVHSGQMSFPGGKKETYDANYEATALREAQEEIGLEPNNVEVLGALTPLYIPPSNFYVESFLAFLKKPQTFVPQHTEVETIHYIFFDQFIKEDSVKEKPFSQNSLEINIPVFELNEQIIWGATAMILSELKTLYYDN